MATAPKIAVVTGANKGIGFAIVKGLCEKYDGKVFLTARDEERGRSAVQKLNKLGYNPDFHQLDIGDSNSIIQFKNFIENTYGGIDVLVNNAGINYPMNATEPFSERAEVTVKVNYFNVLNVCEILFPLLRENARVVNVSSSAGHLSRVPSPDLRAMFSSPTLTIPELNTLMNEFIESVKRGKNVEEGWGTSPYEISKVGLSALTVIQQRNFDREQPNRNIQANSVHPGYVDTDMSEHKGILTPEQGARAPLFLALENHGLKGKYLWFDATVVDWYTSCPTEVLN